MQVAQKSAILWVCGGSGKIRSVLTSANIERGRQVMATKLTTILSVYRDPSQPPQKPTQCCFVCIVPCEETGDPDDGVQVPDTGAGGAVEGGGKAGQE